MASPVLTVGGKALPAQPPRDPDALSHKIFTRRIESYVGSELQALSLMQDYLADCARGDRQRAWLAANPDHALFAERTEQARIHAIRTAHSHQLVRRQIDTVLLVWSHLTSPEMRVIAGADGEHRMGAFTRLTRLAIEDQDSEPWELAKRAQGRRSGLAALFAEQEEKWTS
jgi:hypothetical protein